MCRGGFKKRKKDRETAARGGRDQKDLSVESCLRRYGEEKVWFQNLYSPTLAAQRKHFRNRPQEDIVGNHTFHKKSRRSPAARGSPSFHGSVKLSVCILDSKREMKKEKSCFAP